MLKRRWSGTPAWVDYLAQALYGISHSRLANWPSRATSDWASRLLDHYCRCEKCVARRQSA